MSVLDRLIDLLPLRRFRPELWPAVSTDGSPPLNDEADLAEYLLTQEQVPILLRTHGVDPATVLGRVRSGRGATSVESRESLRIVLMAKATDKLDRQVHMYLQLLAMGTNDIRERLTPQGQLAGDLPFVVAHGVAQHELDANAVGPFDTRHLQILDDPLTPMEQVVPRLREAFALNHEQAVQVMLGIHHSGAGILEVPDDRPSDEFCRHLNHVWRSAGLALYCRPAPAASAAQHNQPDAPQQ
jgi:ATP-dependent Clp protease adapter protein ClpS